jgi:hypothetical protein
MADSGPEPHIHHPPRAAGVESGDLGGPHEPGELKIASRIQFNPHSPVVPSSVPSSAMQATSVRGGRFLGAQRARLVRCARWRDQWAGTAARQSSGGGGAAAAARRATLHCGRGTRAAAGSATGRPPDAAAAACAPHLRRAGADLLAEAHASSPARRLARPPPRRPPPPRAPWPCRAARPPPRPRRSSASAAARRTTPRRPPRCGPAPPAVCCATQGLVEMWTHGNWSTWPHAPGLTHDPPLPGPPPPTHTPVRPPQYYICVDCELTAGHWDARPCASAAWHGRPVLPPHDSPRPQTPSPTPTPSSLPEPQNRRLDLRRGLCQGARQLQVPRVQVPQVALQGEPKGGGSSLCQSLAPAWPWPSRPAAAVLPHSPLLPLRPLARCTRARSPASPTTRAPR